MIWKRLEDTLKELGLVRSGRWLHQPGETHKPLYESAYCRMDYGGLTLWLYVTEHGDKIGDCKQSAGLYPDDIPHGDETHIMALESDGAEAWHIIENDFAAWLVR